MLSWTLTNVFSDAEFRVCVCMCVMSALLHLGGEMYAVSTVPSDCHGRKYDS